MKFVAHVTGFGDAGRLVELHADEAPAAGDVFMLRDFVVKGSTIAASGLMYQVVDDVENEHGCQVVAEFVRRWKLSTIIRLLDALGNVVAEEFVSGVPESVTFPQAVRDHGVVTHFEVVFDGVATRGPITPEQIHYNEGVSVSLRINHAASDAQD